MAENDVGLSADERMVARIIAGRRGRGAAIQSEEICRKTGLENVVVRQIVKRLVEERGSRIGSVTSNPAGFYTIVTQEELEENLDSLKGRAMSILRRMSALRKTAVGELMAEWSEAEQLTLNLGI